MVWVSLTRNMKPLWKEGLGFSKLFSLKYVWEPEVCPTYSGFVFWISSAFINLRLLLWYLENMIGLPDFFFSISQSCSINLCLLWTCQDSSTQLNISYNCRALRLNLHNNVYEISFFLPGECISLNFELIMSTASQETSWRKYPPVSGWVFFLSFFSF